MSDPDRIERGARIICASMHQGFCYNVGDHFGCKSGRGAPSDGSHCVATVDQLQNVGYWETAERVLICD